MHSIAFSFRISLIYRCSVGPYVTPSLQYARGVKRGLEVELDPEFVYI